MPLLKKIDLVGFGGRSGPAPGVFGSRSHRYIVPTPLCLRKTKVGHLDPNFLGPALREHCLKPEFLASIKANDAYATGGGFVGLVIERVGCSIALAPYDHCEESFRKLSILPYAFLFAPAVAPIVYMWGKL